MIQEKAGRIDILFANAGIYEFGTLSKIPEEHFDKIFHANVGGLLFTVEKALPLLSDGASVILTGSIASSFGIPSMSVYSATKAAVRSFARSWILDLKHRGIRVNVLSPSHTATPGLDVLLDEKEQVGLAATIPLQRWGTADDLAKAAVFLDSDDSAFVSGTELVVDGGFIET
jgi:NAD(P)-dependent dehydrogenase (short-subunit alcohol dehydrogenase family)